MLSVPRPPLPSFFISQNPFTLQKVLLISHVWVPLLSSSSSSQPSIMSLLWLPLLPVSSKFSSSLEVSENWVQIISCTSKGKGARGRAWRKGKHSPAFSSRVARHWLVLVSQSTTFHSCSRSCQTPACSAQQEPNCCETAQRSHNYSASTMGGKSDCSVSTPPPAWCWGYHRMPGSTKSLAPRGKFWALSPEHPGCLLEMVFWGAVTPESSLYSFNDIYVY